MARITIVDRENDGRRLDNYLTTLLKTAPKSYIYRIIRSGEVRVNGGRKKAHTKLKLDDKVRIPPFKEAAIEQPIISTTWRENIASRIIYEDNAVLAINKPAGLAVHQGSGTQIGALDIVQALVGPDVTLAHRLDKGTSGCLLFAKDLTTSRVLHEQFRAGRVNKNYRAILEGHLPQEDILVDAALTTQRHDSGQAKTRVDLAGKRALSRFQLIRNFTNSDRHYAYCDVSIETGRTHQIRVHAAHIGHPIVGDLRYGRLDSLGHAPASAGPNIFLHAQRLEFTHPDSKQRIALRAEVPASWQAFLAPRER